MLKVSAFYFEKQKSFIPKKSRCQYQIKKALFTDSIFREGFVQNSDRRVDFIYCLLVESLLFCSFLVTHLKTIKG